MSVIPRQWRLVCDEPALGRWNMAADEAILAAVGDYRQPPTLRLYAWHPPCLSLGIGQHASDVDMYRLSERGWDLVRRPTGGRAILHTDELTYSLVVPADHPLAGTDIITSYRQISGALTHALELLGLQPSAERRTGSEPKRPGAVCFETPSHYEITVDGRKLVGSAQMRRKSGLLQHGTLPLFGDSARICDALAYGSDDERDQAKLHVRSRATTLTEALGRILTWDEAAAAVADGFRAAFDIELTEDALSDGEVRHALELERGKYGAPEHILAR